MAGFDELESALGSTSAGCKDDGRPLDAFYSPEQRDTILQLLNTAAASELAGVKLLRGRKSLSIVEYRSKHGPFRSLESLVKVPLLKHKSAVTVFNSILNPVKKEKKVKISLAKFIRPEVDRSWLEVSLGHVKLVQTLLVSVLIWDSNNGGIITFVSNVSPKNYQFLGAINIKL